MRSSRIDGSASSAARRRSIRHGKRSTRYTEAPDLALVDVDLAEGVDAARTLRSVWPGTTIVALAVRENDEDVVSWVEAGASGLVSREATLAELLDGVEAAARGEVLVSEPVAAALIRRVASVAGERTVANGTLLTRREREIVRLIGDGLSNKEIASSLQIELADGQEPRAQHPREAARQQPHRRRRRRPRERRAGPDLDLLRRKIHASG